MSPELAAALVGGAAGLVTSVLAVLLDRKRRRAEIEKLAAEAEKLREETAEIRRRPREVEQAAHNDLLALFLTPFHGLLTQNQLTFDALLGGRGALEYHPKTLATFFSSLPYNDRRKLYWYQRIDRLRNQNRQILALIQQYGGRIVTHQFRDACAEFRYHVDEWEDVWKALEKTHLRLPEEEEVEVGDPIPTEEIVDQGVVGDDALYANRFPENVWPALATEISEVRRRAGLRSEDVADAGA